jgi:outer membrane protein assembly factor BamB
MNSPIRSLRKRLFIAAAPLLLLLFAAALQSRNDPSTEPSKELTVRPTGADGKIDWPMFGGSPARNMVNPFGGRVPTTWSVEENKFKNVKLVIDLGTKAHGGPVVSGGLIFVGTNNGNPRNPAVKGDKGVLMCFHESDGKFLWQAVHDKLPSGRVNDWPEEGVASAPVVEGDRLYYVSNRCELICASVHGYQKDKTEPTHKGYTDKTDAGVIWRLDMIDKLKVFPHNLAVCSPLIAGDLVFVVTGNGVDQGHINIPSPEAPSFIAVNKRTGKVAWQSNAPTERLAAAKKEGKEADVVQMKDRGELLQHGQWSNPVYAEPNGKPQVIFPGGDGWLYAFTPRNGELLWKFDCNPKDSFYNLGIKGTRNDFIATPVVWDNKLYIGVGQDPEHGNGVGHLWCIDITKAPKNKERDLSPVDDNFDAKAHVNKDSGLVWHFGGTKKKPAKRESPYVFGRTISTVSVHNGLLYAADLNGVLHCLDARTGEQYWEHDTEGETWASPYWVNGHVYLGNNKGYVFVFKHGKEKKLVSKIDMECGPIRNPGVAVNGVLYVMTENPTRLWAISEGGK